MRLIQGNIVLTILVLAAIVAVVWFGWKDVIAERARDRPVTTEQQP